MPALLFVFVAVVVLVVCIRFMVQIVRDDGILHAGWEAAGWLTLGLIVAVGSALTGEMVTSQELGAAADTQLAAKEKPATEKLEPAHPNRQQPTAETTHSAYSRKKVETAAEATVQIPVSTTKNAVNQSPVTSPRSVDGMSRHELLAELHTETTTQFVNAPGFGFERRLRIEDFKTPEKQRLYLPRQPILADAPSDSARKEIPLPDRSSFKKSSSHEENLAELRQLARQLKGNANTETETEDIEPKPVSVVDSEPEWDEWVLSDWELVSTLQHDPPVVYASRAMRMMHRPRQTSTRALDTLEKDALVKLKKGETLVVADGINAIRMLGAVRATAKCIRCHAGKKEGDLLGAFSYELHRMQPIAVAARIGK